MPPASRPTRGPSSTWIRATSATTARSSSPSSPAAARSMARAARSGIELDDEAVRRSIEKIKEREHRGYSYEAADASFELLLRHEGGELRAALPARELPGRHREARRRTRSRPRRRSSSGSASERYIRTAEGNGPVNALDRALRAAITERHPEIAEVELTNFKVRILDEHHGTASVTRVLLDSSDGSRSWSSLGVSENVIEASWEALGRLARVRLPAELAVRGGPAELRGELRADPARPAGPRRARGGAGPRGAALGNAVARPDAAAFRGRLRASHRGGGRPRGRGLERHRRAAPRRARTRLGAR